MFKKEAQVGIETIRANILQNFRVKANESFLEEVDRGLYQLLNHTVEENPIDATRITRPNGLWHEAVARGHWGHATHAAHRVEDYQLSNYRLDGLSLPIHRAHNCSQSHLRHCDCRQTSSCSTACCIYWIRRGRILRSSWNRLWTKLSTTSCSDRWRPRSTPKQASTSPCSSKSPFCIHASSSRPQTPVSRTWCCPFWCRSNDFIRNNLGRDWG